MSASKGVAINAVPTEAIADVTSRFAVADTILDKSFWVEAMKMRIFFHPAFEGTGACVVGGKGQFNVMVVTFEVFLEVVGSHT